VKNGVGRWFSGVEDPHRIGGARDAGCTRDAVEGIIGALLPDVMDDEEGETSINGEFLTEVSPLFFLRAKKACQEGHLLRVAM